MSSIISRKRGDLCAAFRKIGPFATACALFCFALQARAQAQAELRADSNHVETGNPFVLQLRLPRALGRPDSLDFGRWRDILPPQNIVNQTVWQVEGQVFVKSLTVLFFEEDSLDIPPLPIALGNGDTVYSNGFQIRVTATPSPDDLNDMAPIKDIHREPTWWTDYLPWVLGLLAVLGLIAGLYWLARRSPKTRVQSQSIEIPAHELALRKLNALAYKRLTDNGLVKEHYAELTFILREYLEKRFGVPALESTSEETLRYLKNQGVPASVSEELREILEQADLAKFAKIIPPEAFHTEALNRSRKIILETSAHPKRPESQPTTTQ